LLLEALMLKRFAPAVLLCLAAPLVSQQGAVFVPDEGRRTTDWTDVLQVSYAPFSATIVARWIRVQPDGSQSVILSTRRVARDKSGRIFEEHSIFPDGNAEPNPLARTHTDSYADSNTGRFLYCNPDTKKCDSYKRVSTDINRNALHYQYVEAPYSTTLSSGITVRNDKLGKRTLEGQACDETRTTLVFPKGYRGIPKPITVVKELCHDSWLGIDLLLRRIDPFSSSDITFTVTNLQVGDPDPKLFSPPSNFTIKDVR
jgi:hypothetical protein